MKPSWNLGGGSGETPKMILHSNYAFEALVHDHDSSTGRSFMHSSTPMQTLYHLAIDLSGPARVTCHTLDGHFNSSSSIPDPLQP